jgi:hypothetical protein
MPKNTKGGNKTKSLKNSSGAQKSRQVEVPEDEDDSHVAVITKNFGDKRYSCQIVDSNGLQPKVMNVHLSSGTKNKYGKGIIIQPGTYVLIAKREFQKEQADIIFLYRDSEIPYLVQNNIIVITNTDNIEFSANGETNVGVTDNNEGFDFSGI